MMYLQAGDWTARIAPETGGDVAGLQYNRRNVLVPQGSHENPVLHGAPILLPANRTRDGQFSFAGRTYTLPVNEELSHSNLHGQVYSQPFQVCAYSDTSITMTYQNKGESYPFPFTLTVVYTLSPEGFTQRYEIVGEEDFPLTFGLHTTFAEPPRFSVPLKAREERDARFLPTGEVAPLNPSEQQFVSGSSSCGRKISGYYLAAGHTAQIGDFRYTVSGLFDRWILYNGGGNAGFLCVEPQCGGVDGLNTQKGKLVLRAGQRAVFETRISI